MERMEYVRYFEMGLGADGPAGAMGGVKCRFSTGGWASISRVQPSASSPHRRNQLASVARGGGGDETTDLATPEARNGRGGRSAPDEPSRRRRREGDAERGAKAGEPSRRRRREEDAERGAKAKAARAENIGDDAVSPDPPSPPSASSSSARPRR
jgi:hypothetical protein